MECETAAVIVTLQHSERLRRTISALQADLRHVDATITCVINDPQETSTYTRNGVRYVGAGVNLGWAAGIHAGLAGIRSEYVWCIQDDLTVQRGAHAALRAALEADSGLGSVRPLPVRPDGLVGAGSVTATIDDLGCFSNVVPPVPVEPSDVDLEAGGSYLLSSGQFIRRAAWDALGGFDPWFYPWGAIDIDFGRNLRESGWRIRTVGEARMEHAAGGSTTSPFRELLAQRQISLYCAKWSDAEPSSLVNPAIVARVRADRGKPRTVTLEDLREITGICAADLVLFFMRQLPQVLSAERAPLESHLADARFERDAALADLAFVTEQFRTAAAQRDRNAEDRARVLEERARMTESRAWQIASRYWRVRDALSRRSH